MHTIHTSHPEKQSPAKPVIQIRNLHVHHHKNHILKNINLQIPEKRITTFLGPSGCGKTTLLKSLNRLTDLYPQILVEGSITLQGREVLDKKNDITALRQKMGLLSQKPYPLPMSIFDNIAFGLKVQGLKNKTEIAHKVEYHLRQVALWEEVKDRLSAPASRLSIGQQQRLCLGRGLAVNPDVILADEPTSALDPVSSRKIEEQFLELKKDYSIIVVTHNLRQAKRLSDYAVFMYFGEVIEHGPPSEIFNNPQTDALKDYLTLG